MKEIVDLETRKCLVLDGECLYQTIKDLQLLLIAKIILHDLQEYFLEFQVYDLTFSLLKLENIIYLYIS